MSEKGQDKKDIAFVILIGGKSTRFGSDKGIFEFHGKPLISYQLDVLSNFSKDIFIIAHSKQQVQDYINKIDIKKIMAFILDDKDIISDPTVHSPMIGLYSAFQELKKLDYKRAFTFSCDSPLIKANVIELLLKESLGYDCCIPEWNNGFLEPLFAIYPLHKAFLRAKENLEKRSYKLINILDKNWKINKISVENTIKPLDEELLTFINVNGPIDIEKLMDIYKD